MNNKKYIIINSTDIGDIDFNLIQEESKDTMRYSVNRNKAIVKFEGSTPEFLSGVKSYTHNEILKTLESPEWMIPTENIN